MLDGSGWLKQRLDRFSPGNVPVPIVQEAGWASGPVWTGVENFDAIGFRTPDRTARSESLYRLSYLYGCNLQYNLSPYICKVNEWNYISATPLPYYAFMACIGKPSPCYLTR